MSSNTSYQNGKTFKIYGQTVMATFSGRGCWTFRCGDHIVQEQLPENSVQGSDFEDFQVDTSFRKAYSKMKKMLKK